VALTCKRCLCDYGFDGQFDLRMRVLRTDQIVPLVCSRLSTVLVRVLSLLRALSLVLCVILPSLLSSFLPSFHQQISTAPGMLTAVHVPASLRYMFPAALRYMFTAVPSYIVTQILCGLRYNSGTIGCRRGRGATKAQ
jgi:hypothetical protein